jgi:hypothetical protein
LCSMFQKELYNVIPNVFQRVWKIDSCTPLSVKVFVTLATQ